MFYLIFPKLPNKSFYIFMDSLSSIFQYFLYFTTNLAHIAHNVPAVYDNFCQPDKGNRRRFPELAKMWVEWGARK
jgi:hypothetical protein